MGETMNLFATTCIMSSVKRRKVDTHVPSGLLKQRESKSPVPSEQSEVESESSAKAHDEPIFAQDEVAVKTFKDLVWCLKLYH